MNFSEIRESFTGFLRNDSSKAERSDGQSRDSKGERERQRKGNKCILRKSPRKCKSFARTNLKL